MMRFAEKLDYLIELCGTNQSKLMRLTGIAQSSISQMTKGGRKPSMEQAFALARALGIPLDYLADDSQDEPPEKALSEDERIALDYYRSARELEGSPSNVLKVLARMADEGVSSKGRTPYQVVRERALSLEQLGFPPEDPSAKPEAHDKRASAKRAPVRRRKGR